MAFIAAYTSAAISLLVGLYLILLGLGVGLPPERLERFRGRKLVVIAGVVVVGGSLATAYSDRNAIITTRAEDVAAGMRAQVSMPVQIDGSTWLDAISAEGSQLIFDYTVLMQKAEAQQTVGYLKADAESLHCDRPDHERLWQAGLTITFRYADENGGTAGGFKLAPGFCEAWATCHAETDYNVGDGWADRVWSCVDERQHSN